VRQRALFGRLSAAHPVGFPGRIDCHFGVSHKMPIASWDRNAKIAHQLTR
jgi:hypothetical protein